MLSSVGAYSRVRPLAAAVSASHNLKSLRLAQLREDACLRVSKRHKADTALSSMSEAVEPEKYQPQRLSVAPM